MKKKILSIVALIFCVAMIFTGCATVGAVKGSDGKSIYFDEATYFGGHIAEVGDYIYYGNAYVATTSEDFTYSDASKVAYLSRILNEDFYSFDEDVKLANRPHTTPLGVEKVNGQKLVGYENQDMYALGEYLYFTSANIHKTDAMENDYTQVSLFRVKFDGSGFKEIATFPHDEESEISLVKGSDDNYYFVAVVPGDENYDIKAVQVGDSIGKVNTLVEGVEGALIADANSSERNVIYTVDAEKDYSTISVKAVDFATGEESILDEGVAGSSTTLIDRVGDIVFYSYTSPENKVQEVYWQSITKTSTNFSPVNRFYNATTIENVKSAYQGYIFQTAGGALIYKTLDGTKEVLKEEGEYTDVLFVDDQFVYTSTTSKIERVSLADFTQETIVSGVTMISGECGYTDQYIYFYAQLGELEVDEDEDEEEETETDENYYMYRTDKSGNLQIIGKTAKI